MKKMSLSARLLLTSFQKLNASITNINPANNSFIVSKFSKKFYIQGTCTPLNNLSVSVLCDDKERSKEIFAQYSIKVANSSTIRIDDDINSNLKTIKDFVNKNGKTIFKPVYGLRSQGIEIIEEFNKRNVIDIINYYRDNTDFKEIMIEKFIIGNIYRILYINYEPYCALKREPLFIIGNGKNSITELIDIRNKNNKATDLGITSVDLKSPTIQKHIHTQGYSANSILENHKKVFLLSDLKTIETVTNVTEKINYTNLNGITQLIRDFDMKLIGVDVISKNEMLDNLTILEINKTPALALHHFPDFGSAENPIQRVAECILNIDEVVQAVN